MTAIVKVSPRLREVLNASANLIHAVGHGADDPLVSKMLVEPVDVDLPVNAVVGWRLRGNREKSHKN